MVCSYNWHCRAQDWHLNATKFIIRLPGSEWVHWPCLLTPTHFTESESFTYIHLRSESFTAIKSPIRICKLIIFFLFGALPPTPNLRKAKILRLSFFSSSEPLKHFLCPSQTSSLTKQKCSLKTSYKHSSSKIHLLKYHHSLHCDE